MAAEFLRELSSRPDWWPKFALDTHCPRCLFDFRDRVRLIAHLKVHPSCLTLCQDHLTPLTEDECEPLDRFDRAAAQALAAKGLPPTHATLPGMQRLGPRCRWAWVLSLYCSNLALLFPCAWCMRIYEFALLILFQAASYRAVAPPVQPRRLIYARIKMVTKTMSNNCQYLVIIWHIWYCTHLRYCERL